MNIIDTARMFLGRDASPADEAPDELGCAETVSDILFEAGCHIPIMLSTVQLHHFLDVSPEWEKVYVCQDGDVIISPTGSGGENGVSHGHTGIILDGQIASNDSKTGTFIKNYTLDSWAARYKVLGGYPIFFYRRVEAPVKPQEPATDEPALEVVSEAIELAKSAPQYPQLIVAFMGLLKAAGELLNKIK